MVTFERVEDVVRVTHKRSGHLLKFNLLCLYDVHFDSPHCDRDLLLKHISKAVGAVYMEYADFLVFDFKRSTGSKSSMAKVIYHNHGIGKGAQMSRNVLVTGRTQKDIIADVYSYGHVHMESNLTLPRIEISRNRRIQTEPLHVHHGTYKLDKGNTVYEGSRGFNGTSVGGSLINFALNDSVNERKELLVVSSQRAVNLY